MFLSSCLDYSKVVDVFSGIYKILEHYDPDHKKNSTVCLSCITSKLKRLELISIYENIYVGSKEINDYYIPTGNKRNSDIISPKAIYNMFHMWFVISGNDNQRITGEEYIINDTIPQPYKINVGNVFIRTCTKNNVAMAQWLCNVIDQFRFPKLKTSCLDEAFRCVCKKGHVEMAQWLVRTFKQYNFQLCCMESLIDIIKNGHSELLIWSIQTYPAICIWDSDHPFLYALECERFQIIKYLWYLKPSHSVNYLSLYFETIIDTCNLQILRWLWKQVCTMDEYACFFSSEQITRFIKQAQQYDYLHIIEWLHSCCTIKK